MDSVVYLAERRLTSAGGRMLVAALSGRQPAGTVDFRTYEQVEPHDYAPLLIAAASVMAVPTDEELVRTAEHVLRQFGAHATWDETVAVAFLARVSKIRQLSADVAGAVTMAVRDATRSAGTAGEQAARDAARRLLELVPAGEHWGMPRFAPEHRLALGALAGPDADQVVIAEAREATIGQPLALLELDAIARLPVDLRFELAAFSRYRDDDIEARLGRKAAAHRLAADEGYVTAARAVAEGVDARLAAIHAGERPYRADGAAGDAEIMSAIRAYSVGAALDTWFGDVVASTFPRLVVAPNSSKTVPSQALALALARTIAETPSPETVAALASAARSVRHAGVKKKLQRELREARKALVESPRTAVRAGRTAAERRADRATLRARLERSFDREPNPVDPWLRELLDDSVLAEDARAVIWQLNDGRSAIWTDGRPCGPDSESITVDDSVLVRPWHPAAATKPERDSWRLAVVRGRIRQPFRQAFREWYRPAEEELQSTQTSLFRGLIVSVRPFLGLARREDWRITSTDGPIRRENMTGLAISLDVDGHLYPGAEGWATIGDVRFERYDHGWSEMTLADLEPVTLSEALRDVDLLASTSAFAEDSDRMSSRSSSEFERLTRLEQFPVTGQARARREVIEEVLRTWPGHERIEYEQRFARIATPSGDTRVHYATGLTVDPQGRVRPRVQPTPAAVPLPWLPYDEALLESVVAAIVEALANDE